LLHLPPPLPPVPTAASVVVAHDIGQLAFDPGMLLTHGRVAGRRGPGPRRVILGLVIILDDTASLLLGQRRQAPCLQQTPPTLVARKDKLPAAVVGTAFLGGGLVPSRTRHHAPLSIQAKRLGTEPGRRRWRGRRHVDLYAHPLGRTQGPQDFPVPANPVYRHRLDCG